jgi:hypothetical protein
MAPIPYSLYFPLTDFSLTVFAFFLSEVIPWIIFAGPAIAVLWIGVVVVQRELNRQLEEEFILRHFKGYNLLFTPQGVSSRMGFL